MISDKYGDCRYKRICQASILSFVTRVKNLSRHKVPLYIRPAKKASRPFCSAEPTVTLYNMQAATGMVPTNIITQTHDNIFPNWSQQATHNQPFS